MVKLLSSSVTVLVLAIASVQAQTTINPADYPAPNAIPPVNSPQVVAWLKEIDLTGAPNIKIHTGQPPACPNPPIKDECYWTCDGCAADDIVKCKRPNTWGLTFDDGPSPDTTNLLNYLKKTQVAATFFLIGTNVVQHPDIVKREATDGHHLASHTWSHHALTTLTNEQIVAEMKWTEKAVMDATGLRLKYMRPPYGDINNRVRFVLKKLGYIPVDWTGDAFDTNDWQMPTMAETAVLSTFTKSLDTYAASNRSSGFYCLEHDLNAMTVGVAQKLIPLGMARNISIASVPVCENDASPYQLGGTAPMPTLPGATVTVSATISATKSGSPSATTTAGSSGGNKKASGAESNKVLGSMIMAVAVVAGLVLV
ncbi:chitin deacetylase [Modicella reniformis]|uniref:Chitin deacetylase n=1 Tax=Modicella reniformis TaxID=1440133 RepID=A0A9P6MA35_9FUNG|nr:chitin deacetylase [Modicella reniformis]